MTPEAIAAAFQEACRAELQALKPGNVHIYADGHRMTVADFEASAEAAAPLIAAAGAAVGARILGAVQATHARTRQNTNLGIILLCAPLAAAAERMAEFGGGRDGVPPHPDAAASALSPLLACPAGQARPGQGRGLNKATDSFLPSPLAGEGGPAKPGRVRGEPQCAMSVLREHLSAILSTLTVEDAAAAFQAIALANPGGLGAEADHDVRQPARITLLEAMRAAAPRDHIAYQYANEFADIFDAAPLACLAPMPAAAERIYWHFLTRMPDSHVARKFGTETAEEIRQYACEIDRQLASLADGEERHRLLLDVDSTLKSRGINPGTCADMTVAAIFANALQTNF